LYQLLRFQDTLNIKGISDLIGGKNARRTTHFSEARSYA